MRQITIHDDRPKWQQKEDRQYACRTFCRLYRHCSSRTGYSCKKLGGDVIPVIDRGERRGGNG